MCLVKFFFSKNTKGKYKINTGIELKWKSNVKMR